jgi:hypothetical protein
MSVIMAILLPNLDDRRWQDLVDEGRALIPLYAPEWTDQNVHDPGITLMELFAWLAELDIFALNRMTDRARLKFLRLIGIEPQPPTAATAVLSFSLKPGSGAIDLPQEVECSGLDPFGVETVFRTLAPLTVTPANVVAVQLKNSQGFQDLTERWRRNQAFGAFGDVPELGAELYLGLDKPVAAGQSFSLFFTFANSHAIYAERERLLAELQAQRQACEPPNMKCGACGPETVATTPKKTTLPPFLGVRLTWEILTASGSNTGWTELDATNLDDDTRCFTLDGSVRLTPPVAGGQAAIGQVAGSLGYLRVRFAAGAYDAPPLIQNLASNAVAAEQAAPAGLVSWVIAPGVVTTPPQLPATTGIALELDSQGQITSLAFVEGPAFPQFTVLACTPATATTPGNLSIEAVAVGLGDGTPMQKFQLQASPVQQKSFELVTLEDGQWYTWRLRADFDASGRASRDFLLDPAAGTVTFGDGEHGLALPRGARVYAVSRSTRGEKGNLKAGTINRLIDSPHNRALLSHLVDLPAKLSVRHPAAAVGGSPAETLDHAVGRAIDFLSRPQRAVTLQDCEELTKETPGVEVARATAWANLHPSFPCLEAPGVITVVVLPNMPVARPTPSPALLNAVAAYLHRRRTIGSRIEVIGPTYLEVAVRARVQALAGTSQATLPNKITEALNAFLNPLTGGPTGTGWPFGRGVYRAEILQVINRVPGVDYVASLALLVEGCECSPQCGNVCLAPTWLVAAGTHEIEVV